MKTNRWNRADADAAIMRWGDLRGKEFASRLYTARLLGADPDLVLHGGGNVSVKFTFDNVFGEQIDALYIKASGKDLASLEPDDFVVLNLVELRRMRELRELSDEAMRDELRLRQLQAGGPAPSVETLMHAFLPHRFVDHSHADAVLTLTNQPDGVRRMRDLFGDDAAVLPYIRPGFDLARAVAELIETLPDTRAIVLAKHGLVTFAEDAKTCYHRHVELVQRCRAEVAKHTHAISVTYPNAPLESTAPSVSMMAPILRGRIAVKTHNEDQPHARSILAWRCHAEILSLLDDDRAPALAAAGPLTGDHVIQTKPWAAFVDGIAASHPEQTARQLDAAIDSFRKRYAAYLERHGGQDHDADSNPVVFWIRGVGLLGWGRDKHHAEIIADIAEHTLRVKFNAARIGRYESIDESHLIDCEFRALQRAKRTPRADGALAGQVVVISGGAGAIGVAIAATCLREGAHVALADVSPSRIDTATDRLIAQADRSRVLGVVMDVTDDASVTAGYARVVRHFGGVDVIVPNAGVAHAAAIDDMRTADFKRVLDINAVGYLTFMREGIRILKAQGLGGHIVINASKNVFGPGKAFGAYSASKAAGHQLGKVAAIELAPHNIRVNMINADAVFGDEAIPSGLWQEVGPDRAKSRNLNPSDLPEFYRQRNLLKTRIYGRHVGEAVVFFAGNKTPTTGATLPVDGGVIEAFPR